MTETEKEIERLQQKKDKLYSDHMQRYRDGANTRARTTTTNARIGEINDRIQELRKQK